MAEFLLVHGAWHGGWCWRDVADRLRAAGHRVLAPTLTGQGERAHLLTADTGLATHVADILAVLDAEEMADVILVGHSYGARPAALAADRHAAVAAFVSLDGVSIARGSTLLDGAPPDVVAAAKAQRIDGMASPPLPAEAVGVPRDHPLHDWVARRMTPMAFAPLEEPMPPVDGRLDTLPRLYVEARDNMLAGPRRGAAEARQAGWGHVMIDSGHDLMVTAPAQTAAALEVFAAQRR